MRFAALFLDDVDPRALDPDLSRAHFDYLAAHAARITEAGGLKEGPDAPFCGSLWAIEAESRAEAEALVAGDPYVAAGLRPGWRLFVWTRAPHTKGGPP